MKSRHVINADEHCISIARIVFQFIRLLAATALQYLYRSFIYTFIMFASSFFERFVITPGLFLVLFPVYVAFQCAVATLKCIHRLIVFITKRKYIYLLFDFLFSCDNLIPLAATGIDGNTWAVSSRSSSNGANNNEVQQFVERCSICFDSKLDLCLEQCRDQFCLECFRKYINEVAKSSWGLSVTVIRCPVCRIKIPPAEWKRYMPESTIALYEKYNQPYRSFSKHCPSCETEVVPCSISPTGKILKGYSKIIAKNIADFYEKSLTDEQRSGTDTTQLHNGILQIFTKYQWRDSTLPEIHYQLMSNLLSLCNNKEDEHRAKSLSLQILQLEMQPETWRRLQFDHIYFFPSTQCPNCSMDFCLHCGERAHVGLSCEAHMEKLLRDKKEGSTSYDNDDVKTLEWKLCNSRRCPSCSMIINRDEGCNKMDCTYCGFSFCWQCRSLWSEDCGYFLCAFEKKPDRTLHSTERTATSAAEDDAVVELGLPNLAVIHKKNRGKVGKQ